MADQNAEKNYGGDQIQRLVAIPLRPVWHQPVKLSLNLCPVSPDELLENPRADGPRIEQNILHARRRKMFRKRAPGPETVTLSRLLVPHELRGDLILDFFYASCHIFYRYLKTV